LIRVSNEDGEQLAQFVIGQPAMAAFLLEPFNALNRVVAPPDRWTDDVPVPVFGPPRMVCTGCGIVGADAGRTGRNERDDRGEGIYGRHS
jgi:hypothetical protein